MYRLQQDEFTRATKSTLHLKKKPTIQEIISTPPSARARVRSAYSAPHGDNVHAGYLQQKRVAGRTLLGAQKYTWTSTYFVLRAGTLHRFENVSADPHLEQPTDIFDLSGAVLKLRSTTITGKIKQTTEILITFRDKSIPAVTVRTDNRQAAIDLWVPHLNNHIDNADVMQEESRVKQLFSNNNHEYTHPDLESDSSNNEHEYTKTKSASNNDPRLAPSSTNHLELESDPSNNNEYTTMNDSPMPPPSTNHPELESDPSNNNEYFRRPSMNGPPLPPPSTPNPELESDTSDSLYYGHRRRSMDGGPAMPPFSTTHPELESDPSHNEYEYNNGPAMPPPSTTHPEFESDTSDGLYYGHRRRSMNGPALPPPSATHPELQRNVSFGQNATVHHPKDIALSMVVDGKGVQHSICGETSEFTVHAPDLLQGSDGSDGSDDWDDHLVVELVLKGDTEEEDVHADVTLTFDDNDDMRASWNHNLGVIKGKYLVVQKGTWNLHVKYQEHHVFGSPFPIQVASASMDSTQPTPSTHSEVYPASPPGVEFDKFFTNFILEEKNEAGRSPPANDMRLDERFAQERLESSRERIATETQLRGEMKQNEEASHAMIQEMKNEMEREKDNSATTNEMKKLVQKLSNSLDQFNAKTENVTQPGSTQGTQGTQLNVEQQKRLNVVEKNIKSSTTMQPETIATAPENTTMPRKVTKKTTRTATSATTSSLSAENSPNGGLHREDDLNAMQSTAQHTLFISEHRPSPWASVQEMSAWLPPRRATIEEMLMPLLRSLEDETNRGKSMGLSLWKHKLVEFARKYFNVSSSIGTILGREQELQQQQQVVVWKKDEKKLFIDLHDALEVSGLPNPGCSIMCTVMNDYIEVQLQLEVNITQKKKKRKEEHVAIIHVYARKQLVVFFDI